MLQLDKSLAAWGTAEFNATLKEELAQHAAQLPLQQGLTGSSQVVDTPITVLINHAEEAEGALHIRVGVFYEGRIGGCSCADDPTPISENTEYCEMSLIVNKAGAVTTAILRNL